jgi:hypothetical protein
MIAFHTKFVSATNNRGSRIKAYTANGRSATISYPHDKSYELAHFEAVKALVAKHGITTPIDNMAWGDSADGNGYVFCFANQTVTQ